MESGIDAHRSGELMGIIVFDSEGEPIGTVEEIFYDETRTQPSWVRVAAYGSGNSPKPLPLEGAVVRKGGLTLPCATRYLPRAFGSRADIGRAPAQELRAHYGLSVSQVEPKTLVLT
jgi:hypothetical protein